MVISINDGFFVLWNVVCLGLIVGLPGRMNEKTYSRVVATIFILTAIVVVWFHETVIDVARTSPIHGAILALAQLGTMTLASKLWLAINYHKLAGSIRNLLVGVLYGSLLTVILGSYWLYKYFPEVQLLIYPLASVAISLSAQILEDRWHT